MKFTRKQELLLIDLGLRYLLENLKIVDTVSNRKYPKWTPERTKKFKATAARKRAMAMKMKTKWIADNNKK